MQSVSPPLKFLYASRKRCPTLLDEFPLGWMHIHPPNTAFRQPEAPDETNICSSRLLPLTDARDLA